MAHNPQNRMAAKVVIAALIGSLFALGAGSPAQAATFRKHTPSLSNTVPRVVGAASGIATLSAKVLKGNKARFQIRKGSSWVTIANSPKAKSASKALAIRVKVTTTGKSYRVVERHNNRTAGVSRTVVIKLHSVVTRPNNAPTNPPVTNQPVVNIPPVKQGIVEDPEGSLRAQTQLFNAINTHRMADLGYPSSRKFRWDSCLAAFADTHTRRMVTANVFDHSTDPSWGVLPEDYTSACPAIGGANVTIQRFEVLTSISDVNPEAAAIKALASWLASPSHAVAIDNCFSTGTASGAINKIGIGAIRDDRGTGGWSFLAVIATDDSNMANAAAGLC